MLVVSPSCALSIASNKRRVVRLHDFLQNGWDSASFGVRTRGNVVIEDFTIRQIGYIFLWYVPKAHLRFPTSTAALWKEKNGKTWTVSIIISRNISGKV